MIFINLLVNNVGNQLSLHKPEFEPKPGGRLNKKDGLSRYGDSHVKDKTS